MAQQPLVTTALGPVLGTWKDHSARFLGIPYAKPPVGDLRFAAPQPPEAWTEPLEATAYGPTAQRRTLGGGPTIIPEPSVDGDAVLNLSVFTPAPASDAALPVLVWIHGGGYVAGSAASPWYDGATFNRDGVVTVAVGYRLGVEGFLHLEDAPDNRGVLDWIAALEWVRDNIAAFGGDPAKVTIAGQSAGGGAVQTLMATPAAHGLFRAVISVSGAIMEPQSRADGLRVSEVFTERTGLPATAAALRDVPGETLQEFEDSTMAPTEGQPPIPKLMLAPFTDGVLIPEDVVDAFVDGSASSVPLMLGATLHEFNMIGEFALAGAPMEVAHAVLPALGLTAEGAARYLALHEGADTGQIVGQAVTDRMFRVHAAGLAEARAAHGLPTWLYSFEWLSGSPIFGAPKSFHCLDLPFAFDILGGEHVENSTGPDAPQKLADVMHGAWIAFIRDLDPGADWPQYDTARRATMVFDTDSRVEEDRAGAERAIWLPETDAAASA
ncbi:carboxylesterase/lipase family protein [Yinghuangia seranimata]|uniref:carboxylesterase/lipase family protein n=1 Tax=Yinghuangia seranimata TaxID=408067 RepID=UPI00248CC64A|nr:carboxylesterase family protein [Yinghuangia seranimata]MDI2131171.1 carboxylesterase family protein [Yinghuangia seranimata]